jgi:1,4-dihydroxy-2-naphthoate octaprenyltransferase
VSAAERPSPFRTWVMATRPATLTAATVPVMVGAAVAHHAAQGREYRVGALVAALLGAMFIQIGTNLANDVFDHEKGADTAERLGPVRVTQAGLLSPRQVRAGMVVAFALATLAGVYLTWVAGWAVVAIGVASIASGVAYTGGPWPLGYNGLGDVFVFVFFGLVAVCGTVFVALGHVPALAWVGAVPIGALATAILVVNNVRDHTTDVKAGKRTLVVRFGRAFGVREYAAMWLVAWVVPTVIAAWLRAPSAALPLVTLPVGLRLVRAVSVLEGRDLNPVLAATAKTLFVYGLLFALGLLALPRNV